MLVTDPVPLPGRSTWTELLTRSKVAVTERAADIDTVQSPVPEQSPDQPVNEEFTIACAWSTTFAPCGMSASHLEPQSIVP